MLKLWTFLVGLSASCGIAITAFGLILHMIEIREALRRIALIAGCAMLLTLLPPIIIGIWSGISPWQKIGILSIVVIAAFVFPTRKRPIRGGNANRH